jgi:hypothetical protein
LNVESEEDVWFYYYMEFPLVHLHGRAIQSIWKMPIGGSDAFAVLGDHALFRGGYDERSVYQLSALGNTGSVNLLASIELEDQNGNKLAAERVVGRSNAIHFVSGDGLYRLDVEAALAV